MNFSARGKWSDREKMGRPADQGVEKKPQAFSQGRYTLEARGSGLKKNRHRQPGFELPASSRLHVSIYKSRTMPDNGLRRGFSTPG
jgi:hypothetical protein